MTKTTEIILFFLILDFESPLKFYKENAGDQKLSAILSFLKLQKED